MGIMWRFMPLCYGVCKPTTRSKLMTLEVDKDKGELVIRIPLQQPTPSASGKTLVIASTRGNVTTKTEYDGKPITIGLNAYLKR
jgi:hypothetical protein